MENNMAPGSENDPRSGCDDDIMDCPMCFGKIKRCYYCKGEGVVFEREYLGLKELEKEDQQANE